MTVPDSAGAAVSRLRQLCAELKQTAAQLSVRKHEGELDLELVRKAVLGGTMTILDLKSTNRELCESVEELREHTATTKLQLERTSLQLENLLYEKAHHHKEIADCRNFTSAYTEEQVELLPVEQFQKQAPSSVLEAADVDGHAELLQRLAHEKQLRVQILQKLEEVKARKQALSEAVGSKRKTLESINSQLKGLDKPLSSVLQTTGVAVGDLAKAAEDASKLQPLLQRLYEKLASAQLLASSSVRLRINKVQPARPDSSNPQQPSSKKQKSGGSDNTHNQKPAYELEMTVHEAGPDPLVVVFRSLDDTLLTARTANESDMHLLSGLYPEDDEAELAQSEKYLEASAQNDSFLGKPFSWLTRLAASEAQPSAAAAAAQALDPQAAPDFLRKVVGKQQEVQQVAELLERIGAARQKPVAGGA